MDQLAQKGGIKTGKDGLSPEWGGNGCVCASAILPGPDLMVQAHIGLHRLFKLVQVQVDPSELQKLIPYPEETCWTDLQHRMLWSPFLLCYIGGSGSYWAVTDIFLIT